MLQFKDIMTREMVYYDKEYKDECAEFCKARNINYLPAIHNPKLAFQYSRQDNRFEQFSIKPGQQVLPNENIFKSGIADKFGNHEILFVIDAGHLYGVVHFSDYNRSIVYEEIYNKLFMLERGLIYLVTEYGGKTVGELEDHLKTRQENRSPNPEELLNRHDFSKRKTNLIDVMEFSTNIDLLRIRNINKINNLRNKIAHSKDLIAKMDYQSGLLKYNYQAFENLVEGKISLEIAIKQVANRLYFMKASANENFNIRASNVYEEAFGRS